MKRTIAVTGSEGFVGSHLVKLLEEDDYKVIRIDSKLGLDIINDSVCESISAFDVVVHLAAKIYVPESFENPREFYYVNLISTLNMLELARKNKAKFILQSSYLYGNPQYIPIDEKHPLQAHNPYAQSKLLCEQLCRGYNRDFGVPVTILRPFNIYGPGQSSLFLIPKIIHGIKSGHLQLDDPYPRRDYVHVNDAVNAIKLALEYNLEFGIFNIGSGVSHSVKDIVDIVGQICKTEFEVTYSNHVRKNEISSIECDYSEITRVMNWSPKVSFEHGLAMIIAKENSKTLFSDALRKTE
ncbi:MAG: GDP-mannose 4,6-dehydratase [Candidatus Cloacimonetes bacterium]|nr:GDP-mannose 4,6-dehydratase [Candidatus Cloacimonadota bacterium]